MHDDLTAQDIEMMQKELDHRKLELMPELIEEVKRTRAFGDLSENFEYKAAKQAQNRNRSRIRYLERMIKSAHVIEAVSYTHLDVYKRQAQHCAVRHTSSAAGRHHSPLGCILFSAEKPIISYVPCGTAAARCPSPRGTHGGNGPRWQSRSARPPH